MNRPPSSHHAQRLLLALLLGSVAAMVAAQDASVAPGVNSRFLDQSVDADVYVDMFESESREIYAHRREIVDALGLDAGEAAADVGAGTGFFSRMIAAQVGPTGVVYAVDIAQNLLDHIDRISQEQSISNIETVLGGDRSTNLAPASVDLVFVCDTYHHFEYPNDVLASVHDALRPGGELVVVDFERIRGVSPAFAINHVRAGKGTVTDEIKDAGFDFLGEVDLMRDQYVLRFRKR